jgi:DNA-binding PadR family transcriptional regulator
LRSSRCTAGNRTAHPASLEAGFAGEPGALYPALHRLEQQGWIRAKWGESENNRRAKFYSLTLDGAKYLRQEQAQWKRLSSAIGLVLEMS